MSLSVFDWWRHLTSQSPDQSKAKPNLQSPNSLKLPETIVYYPQATTRSFLSNFISRHGDHYARFCLKFVFLKNFFPSSTLLFDVFLAICQGFNALRSIPTVQKAAEIFQLSSSIAQSAQAHRVSSRNNRTITAKPSADYTNMITVNETAPFPTKQRRNAFTPAQFGLLFLLFFSFWETFSFLPLCSAEPFEFFS